MNPQYCFPQTHKRQIQAAQVGNLGEASKQTQGHGKVVFFPPLSLYKPFNGPITDDCGHFAYQLLLTSRPYHFKLNLANGPDERD